MATQAKEKEKAPERGKIDQKVEKEEGVVIGSGGNVTRPTVYVVPGAYFKEPTSDTRYAGLCLVEGNTFNGFHYKTIVDMTQALTEEGAFYVFKGHWPDAVREGFSVKAVSKEEAEKMQSEWSKKLQEAPKG